MSETLETLKETLVEPGVYEPQLDASQIVQTFASRVVLTGDLARCAYT
jgi:hypothetical protein